MRCGIVSYLLDEKVLGSLVSQHGAQDPSFFLLPWGQVLSGHDSVGDIATLSFEALGGVLLSMAFIIRRRLNLRKQSRYPNCLKIV